MAGFHEKILRPILNNEKSPSLAKLCEDYAIKDEATASNMAITVKRHFRRVLKRHIRKYVDSDEEVEEEIFVLIGFLSQRGA